MQPESAIGHTYKPMLATWRQDKPNSYCACFEVFTDLKFVYSMKTYLLRTIKNGHLKTTWQIEVVRNGDVIISEEYTTGSDFPAYRAVVRTEKLTRENVDALPLAKHQPLLANGT